MRTSNIHILNLKNMKTAKYLFITALAVCLTACNYDIQPDKLYIDENGVKTDAIFNLKYKLQTMGLYTTREKYGDFPTVSLS